MASRTRDEFAALGAYRSQPERLFGATRSTDFDIQLWEWIALASPAPDADPAEKVEGWAQAWIMASRWAGSVGRRAASLYDVERAGAGPLLDAIRHRVDLIAIDWGWPRIRELAMVPTDRLETTYALLEASSVRVDPDWRYALVLELTERGQLLRSFEEAGDYDGSARIHISPTQLYSDSFGRPLPRSRLRRIVDEWCDLFSGAPTPIQYLSVDSRAPKRLIAALHGQTQLRGLWVKWGDYDDISALARMPHLWSAELHGATGLTDLAPLASAHSLRVLRIDDSRRVADYSPLRDLAGLEEFGIGSGFNSPTLWIPTIAFLGSMRGLRSLDLGVRVSDEDYSPLLQLARLDSLRLVKQRGMRPTYEELAAQIPALR
jgi:hypothetical protein